MACGGQESLVLLVVSIRVSYKSRHGSGSEEDVSQGFTTLR